MNLARQNTANEGRTRKRLLYLTMFDPDLEVTGSNVRAGAFVKHLARAYDVSLVHMSGAGHRVDPAIERRFFDRDNRLGVSQRVRVPFSQPSYFIFSPSLYRAASGVLQRQRFDVLVAEHGLSGIYARMLSARYRVPFVYSSHNVEYALNWRQRGRDLRRGLLASYMYWAERSACRSATLVVAITESDRAVYRRWIPDERLITVPQGFDSETCHPFYPAPPTTPAVVLFVGNFRDAYNREAAEDIVQRIAPDVARMRGDVVFQIVGAHAPATWTGGNVEVTGFVDDLVPYLRRANLILAPMPYAAGMATKVVLGLAFGKPVLTIPEVAENIPGTYHQLVAAPLDRFAAEIIRILGAARGVDATEFPKLSEAFAWSNVIARLRERLESILEPTGGNL